MQLSTRNQLKATVTGIKKGPVSTKVILDVGGQTMVSIITTSSADALNLTTGDPVTTLVKATSVMIMK